MIKTLIESLSCAHSEPVLTRFTAQTDKQHHELLRCSYITWSLLKEGVQKVYTTSGINPQLFSKQEASPVSETTFHISWISLQDYTETLTCLIPSVNPLGCRFKRLYPSAPVCAGVSLSSLLLRIWKGDWRKCVCMCVCVCVCLRGAGGT